MNAKKQQTLNRAAMPTQAAVLGVLGRARPAAAKEAIGSFISRRRSKLQTLKGRCLGCSEQRAAKKPATKWTSGLASLLRSNSSLR